MFIYFIFIYYYLTAIGCYPVAVDLTLGGRPYTDIDKEIRLYIKGILNNKEHTP
jgi:hypothetical protein